MTPSGARLIVVATATACAYVVVALPRAIEPKEPPTYVPRHEAHEVEVPAPPDDPMLERLEALVLARGALERGASEPATATEERRRRTEILARSVETHLGRGALDAFARALVARIDRRVHGESDEDEAILGDFERQLAMHGVFVGGERIAPRIVVRALAASRLATLMAFEPTRFMTEAETEAYYAWAALRPGAEAKELRAFGMAGYAELDPVRAAEARAYFAFREGRFADAASLYQRVHEQTGELRARNHAIAALVRAEAGEAPN